MGSGKKLQIIENLDRKQKTFDIGKKIFIYKQ